MFSLLPVSRNDVVKKSYERDLREQLLRAQEFLFLPPSLQIHRRRPEVPYQGAGEGTAVQADTNVSLSPGFTVY